MFYLFSFCRVIVVLWCALLCSVFVMFYQKLSVYLNAKTFFFKLIIDPTVECQIMWHTVRDTDIFYIIPTCLVHATIIIIINYHNAIIIMQWCMQYVFVFNNVFFFHSLTEVQSDLGRIMEEQQEETRTQEESNRWKGKAPGSHRDTGML